MRRSHYASLGAAVVIVAAGVAYAAFHQPPGAGPGVLDGDVPVGSVLGWGNQLYAVVGTVPKSDVSAFLGNVSYHGRVSGEFFVYRLRGTALRKSVVFLPRGEPMFLQAVAVEKRG
jgi:hypothetical protein